MNFREGVIRMEYKIPYGKGEQVVSLPEEHVSQVLLPPVTDKPQTVAKLMEEALAHPIGTPTLDQMVKPGEKVVLLVSDITRAWARFDLFLPILVARLNQIGVPDADISIIIATGKHRLNSAAEKEEIIGSELFHRIKVYDHNPALLLPIRSSLPADFLPISMPASAADGKACCPVLPARSPSITTIIWP